MLLVVHIYCCQFELRLHETQEYKKKKKKKICILSALSINIHTVGGVEESKDHVTFLSLRITDPLDSEASTAAQFASFLGK